MPRKFDTGVYFAAGLAEYLKLVFDITGVGEDRILHEYCSAAEGAKFAEVTRNYTAKIEKLGQNPISNEKKK
ncbi:MAG: hydrogenase iron-sulfur subunit [Promethearchaeota archaeon]